MPRLLVLLLLLPLAEFQQPAHAAAPLPTPEPLTAELPVEPVSHPIVIECKPVGPNPQEVVADCATVQR